MKRQHKVVLGVGFGLLMVAIGVGSLGNDQAEADASARRFLRLLDAGDYGQARDTLSHFKKPPTVEFLELWWSGCTRKAGHSTRMERTNSFVKSSFIHSSSLARLTYSIDANGSTIPVFLTVEHREGAWVVTDFSCAMPRADIERMKSLMH